MTLKEIIESAIILNTVGIILTPHRELLLRSLKLLDPTIKCICQDEFTLALADIKIYGILLCGNHIKMIKDLGFSI